MVLTFSTTLKDGGYVPTIITNNVVVTVDPTSVSQRFITDNTPAYVEQIA